MLAILSMELDNRKMFLNVFFPAVNSAFHCCGWIKVAEDVETLGLASGERPTPALLKC